MAALAEELNCIFCMSLFRVPTTVPCGHTFCTDCLEGYWCPREARDYKCPICQKAYKQKPELRKNTVIAALLERLPSHEEVGGGLCLDCGAHLGPHRQGAHLLFRPLSAQLPWPCRDHARALELYCPAHGLPVCPECAGQQHGECQPLPLQQRLQAALDHRDRRIRDIDSDIERKEEAILKRRNESRQVQKSVSEIKKWLTNDFSAMRKYIEQQERATLERIEHEQQLTERKINDSITTLTAELTHQKETKTCLEQPVEDNWLELLKDTQPTREIDSPSPLPVEDISLDDETVLALTTAVAGVKRKLLENTILDKYILPVEPAVEHGLIDDLALQAESVASGEREQPVDLPLCPAISSLPLVSVGYALASADCPAGTRSSHFSRCAVDVTFDPQTVSGYLSLAEENRKVMVSEKKKSYPPSPIRFINSQLLCSQGFSAGCKYWEISRGDCEGWAIGIANKKIAKKDRLGRTEVSWCLEWSNHNLSVWHNNQETPINQQNPQTVGVFLDCEKNMLSFYSVADELTLLHTYKHSFPYPVFPAFWLYSLKKGNLTIHYIKKN